MPAVSKKQERFMQAVAHNPKFAKQAGVSQSVGREFTKSEGGQMKESKKMAKKGFDPKSMDMKKGGKVRGGGVESKGKTKGKMVAMMKGGMTRGCK